jgi:hypothetical protein
MSHALSHKPHLGYYQACPNKQRRSHSCCCSCSHRVLCNVAPDTQGTWLADGEAPMQGPGLLAHPVLGSTIPVSVP